MKSRADVAKLMDDIFVQCQQTRAAAHLEYAHEEENALRNFEQTGADLSIPREKVWWIFAKKHWDGVLAWINGHRSQREDVRGRIKDLIVYLVLLWAMVDDVEKQDNPATRLLFTSGAVSNFGSTTFMPHPDDERCIHCKQFKAQHSRTSLQCPL